MKTIALRFGEHFAPACGTIAAHEVIIDQLGYVWYGKMGSCVSVKNQVEIMNNKEPRILLIRSGKVERYWAYVSEITNKTPAPDGIPEYYRDTRYMFKTWFKITRFQLAEKDVMSKYVVASSKSPLGMVSKHSMSPFFIIENQEDVYAI